MRLIALLAAILVVGCSASPDGPETPEPALARPGLYTDAEIRRLAKYDIDKEAGPDRNMVDIPCLDVVPNGESHPRKKVFERLKLDEGRLRGFWSSGLNHVVFLTWQVSPSYDIVCMSAINDLENDGLEMTDPQRKVYGIRLVTHAVDFQRRPGS